MLVRNQAEWRLVTKAYFPAAAHSSSRPLPLDSLFRHLSLRTPSAYCTYQSQLLPQQLVRAETPSLEPVPYCIRAPTRFASFVIPRVK